MSKLIFKDDEILYGYWHEGEEIVELFENSILPAYGCKAYFADDLTFEGFLMHLINDPLSEIISQSMFEAAGNREKVLQEFHDVLLYEERDPAKDIDFLRVHSQALEIHSDSDLDEYPTDWWFDGYGDWNKHNPNLEEPMKGGIAVEYTPICNLAHLPLKIDRKIKIFDHRESESGFSSEPTRVMEGFPTVFEVIRAIIYEMTWEGVLRPGDPTRLDGIREMIDDIESGEADVVNPFDNVKDILGENEDDNSVTLEYLRDEPTNDN